MERRLSLTEYSAKYDVSVSTLRRKIRKQRIASKMVDGKYFLPDQELRNLTSQGSTSSQKIMTRQKRLASQTTPKKSTKSSSISSSSKRSSKKAGLIAPPQEQSSLKKEASPQDSSPAPQDVFKEYRGEGLEPLLEVEFEESQPPPGEEGKLSPYKEENLVFLELKKAFLMVLSEKEDQITSLKAHVADLQTLNKVLESELKKNEPPFFNLDFDPST